MLADSFDDQISILCEEEEAATLARLIMLLSSIGFEYLVPISAWLKRLNNTLFAYIVLESQILEYLWCKDPHFDFQIYQLRFLFVKFLFDVLVLLHVWSLVQFILCTKRRYR